MKDIPLDQPTCSYKYCTKRVFTSCDQCGITYCSDHVRLSAPRRYLCSTCLGEPEPEAPPTNMPSQPVPTGLSVGGCLKGTSITLGILSIAGSVLAIVNLASFYATYHKEVGGGYGEATLGLGIIEVLWLPLGALPGLLACLCAGVYIAGVYISRKPSKRGSVLWPMLIGGLALGLGIVTLVLLNPA